MSYNPQLDIRVNIKLDKKAYFKILNKEIKELKKKLLIIIIIFMIIFVLI